MPPLQMAPNVLITGSLVVIVLLVALLLWRRDQGVSSRPDVLELADGTRLSPGEREAVTAAREYVVAANGETTVQELRTAVYPDHRVGYRTAQDWWRGVVGPALDHMPDVEVPREDGEVADDGTVRAEDVDDVAPTWIPDASPDEGERFGHAREPRRGDDPQVRVSDGQNEAVLRVGSPEDVRVVSWQGGDVDVDWLADAREYLRETVQEGDLDLEAGGRQWDGREQDGRPTGREDDATRQDEPARER